MRPKSRPQEVKLQRNITQCDMCILRPTSSTFESSTKWNMPKILKIMYNVSMYVHILTKVGYPLNVTKSSYHGWDEFKAAKFRSVVGGRNRGHYYRNIVRTRSLKCDDTGDFRRRRRRRSTDNNTLLPTSLDPLFAITTMLDTTMVFENCDHWTKNWFTRSWFKENRKDYFPFFVLLTAQTFWRKM